MVFVAVKAALLLATLPVAIPIGIGYQFFSALNSAHLAFLGFLHLTEAIWWGTAFFTKLVLFPFFPILHFFVFPPMVVLKLACDIFMSVVVFFTFPVAYLLGLWHVFHKFHMHLAATLLFGLKLLNL